MSRNIIIVCAVIVIVAVVACFKSEMCAVKNNDVASTQPAKSLPRLVELGAGKCKSCKMMAPIIEEVRKEYAGRVLVESIDVIKEEARAKTYNWRLIPCQVFIDTGGEEVWRHEGFLAKKEIVARFKEMGVN